MKLNAKQWETIREQNPDYDLTKEDLYHMIQFADRYPFSYNPYLPLVVALWIEQLLSYIDYNDTTQYQETCDRIKEKGFGFLIPIMEASYGKTMA